MKPTITPASMKALAEGDTANFIAASTPGGIEAQEAAGQRALVSNFKTLPKDLGKDGRAIAEKLGFVFGEDADEIFVNVTPPAGWSLRPTEHSMHSEILDASGVIRGSVFYKAAFYDRRANGDWKTRYGYSTDYDDAAGRGRTVHIKDFQTGESLWSERIDWNEDEDWIARSARDKAVLERSEKFLESFPRWKDPTAYWNS